MHSLPEINKKVLHYIINFLQVRQSLYSVIKHLTSLQPSLSLPSLYFIYYVFLFDLLVSVDWVHQYCGIIIKTFLIGEIKNNDVCVVIIYQFESLYS